MLSLYLLTLAASFAFATDPQPATSICSLSPGATFYFQAPLILYRLERESISSQRRTPSPQHQRDCYFRSRYTGDTSISPSRDSASIPIASITGKLQLRNVDCNNIRHELTLTTQNGSEVKLACVSSDGLLGRPTSNTALLEYFRDVGLSIQDSAEIPILNNGPSSVGQQKNSPPREAISERQDTTHARSENIQAADETEKKAQAAPAK